MIEEPKPEEYEVRLVLEKITYTPTKMTVNRSEHGWLVDEIVEKEEDGREVVDFLSIQRANCHNAVIGDYERAYERLTQGLRITKAQAKEIAQSLAHGLAQPEAAVLSELDRTLIISEMAHSMNRFQLISNDNIDEFISMVKSR